MIAAFLYRNPRLLVLSLLVIIMAGLTAIWVLPRLEDPILSRRVAVISTVYPGANAIQIESTITRPLEEALAGISEIKQIRSNCGASISNIVIELDDAVTDVEPVWSRVHKKMVDTSQDFPSICQATELEIFPLKAYASILSLEWRDANAQDLDGQTLILRRLAKTLRSRILAISGTEQVNTFGDPGEEIVVRIEPDTLFATGLSAAALAQQVQSGHADQAAGSLQSDDANLMLDLKAPDLAIARIEDVQINWGPDPHHAMLSELATVEKRTTQPTQQRAIINEKQAIVLGVMVDDAMRVDQWSNQLDRVVQNFQADYPSEVRVATLFSQRGHIEHRMEVLIQNLAMSTAAVVLVLFLLMGWRSMVVVAMALPLSALLVFAGMRALEIPIHQMSVTGLIVALGLLIDNAIVMVDEVRSRMYAGKTPSVAIRQAVRHLAMPLFGSTITTALAFLPIATLPGPAGEFVGTIAISVILAILASFGLAMTLIPALVGLTNRQNEKQGIANYGLRLPALEAIYRRSLILVFRFPVLGVVLGLILPVLGFVAAGQLDQQFFPPSDRQQIQIELERPARDTLGGVEETVNEIRKIVENDSRLVNQHWFLGSSAPTFYYNVVPRRRGTPFYAQAFIDVAPGQSPQQIVRNLQSQIDDKVRDSRVIVRQLEQGPPFDAPIEIRIFGTDLETLHELGEQLRALLSETADVIHTRSDLQDSIPKLVLDLDPVALQQAGLNETDISQFLYTSVQGASAGMTFDGVEEVPVRVVVNFDPDSQAEQLAALMVPSPKPSPRPAPLGPPGLTPVASPTLGSLGEFELDADIASVTRIDRQRVNEVKAYINAGVLPSVVVNDFRERLQDSDFYLPEGYRLELGGEMEQRSQAVNNLIANAVVLFSLMLLTLVAVFRSFRSAMIVAMVGGLSVGLGPLALYCFGYPFGFMAIVGTMGLVGVAINDSIVVLAAIGAAPRERWQTAQGMADIVCSCTRHILATTVTTIAGFVPLVVAGGEFWPPLAITIAGGVGGATLLALYFVPSLKRILYPTRHKV